MMSLKEEIKIRMSKGVKVDIAVSTDLYCGILLKDAWKKNPQNLIQLQKALCTYILNLRYGLGCRLN